MSAAFPATLFAGRSFAVLGLGRNGAPAARALAADARRLLGANPGIALVAVTLGEHGSLLVTRDEVVRHRGIETKVVDTVGAGDAFTAALTVHRLLGKSLAVQSEAANRWGSWVAGQSGAMPSLSEAERTAVERTIKASAAEGTGQ